MYSELVFWCVLLVIVFYKFYKWATVENDYFKKKLLKHLKPNFLVGNTIGLFLKQYNPVDFFDSMYYRYPNEKLIGLFDMREPVYLFRDPDLIRQITIKDHTPFFEDHTPFMEDESDSLFAKTLFCLSGMKWREMRANLSPAFTSAKMRNMFELVVECSNEVTKYLVQEATQKRTVRCEMRDLFARYVCDVIASCAFGITIDSLKDPKNEFFTLSTNAVNFNSVKLCLRLLIVRTFPRLSRAFDFEFFPARARKFISSMVLDTMAERQKRNIFRPDLINILMQMRDGSFDRQNDETQFGDAGFATVEESNIGKVKVKRSWTDEELIAQCFLFTVAGIDTTPTVMGLLSYELAINQDIQQKLYKEIREINATLNGGALTYNTLAKMKYMDQVISEALRMWSNAIFTTRKCTKDYEFELDGKKILIESGRNIWLPIHSIHHDAQYYDQPNKFDPEKFNEENKLKIKPGSFIPFGIGPRNCIGSRFGLMTVKAMYFYLLLNFSIQPYAKTQIPIKFANTSMGRTTENGIHLELRPRA